MATLTTSDIKTVDELPEITGDSLTNDDSFLAFDKSTNSHKKIQAMAFKAWVASAAPAAEAAARAAAASASAAAASASAAAASKTAADGAATLSESWAVGGTGTRTGEDTNNSKYYAQQAAASATSAAGSSTDAAGSLAEVRSALATGGIVEGHRTVVVTADMASLADVDTTFRIRGNATLTVRDSTVFSTRITIINETGSPQVVSLTLSGGSGTRVIAAGQSWKYVWTGYWNDGLGIAPAVTANDPRPVASSAVQSAILSSMSRGVVPDGVSIDDMVGPEWVGTWYVPASTLGHKPYVAGAIYTGSGYLRISCPFANGSSNTVHEFLDLTGIPQWKATRIYRNGWLNHSDTMLAGHTYGGWKAEYNGRFLVAESSPLLWNGIKTYLNINPGNSLFLHFDDCDKPIYGFTNYAATALGTVQDLLWRCSLDPAWSSGFVWAGKSLNSTMIALLKPDADRYILYIDCVSSNPNPIWDIGRLNVSMPLDCIN